MLDLNQVRADFADFLADHAGTRHSLDAALMHVVERAYQQGMADAWRAPEPGWRPLADAMDFEVAA
jgi:hypothetical protein